MFEFIPIEYYATIFYNFLLIIIIVNFLDLLRMGYVIFNPSKKEYVSFALLLVVTLYIGLRPISAVFVDMTWYNYRFEQFASGAEIRLSNDILWHVFMKFCSSIMTAKIFFLVCASLYIIPLYVAAKKWLANDLYFLFLMFIASFSFWGYGTNGIRNGIATSIFVMALSFYRKKYWQYGLLALSYFIHGSLILPIFAYALTLF